MNTKFKRTFSLACIALILIVVFSKCEADDGYEFDKKLSVKIYLTGEVNQYIPPCLVIDENNPSNRYIRVDSVLAFGFGTEFVLPDSLKNSNLKIVASGKMRESDNFKGCIVMSLSNTKDSTLFWGDLKSEKHVKQFNTWVPFKDSITIDKQINSSSAKTLRVFPYKNNGKGTFDIDDLVIEIIRE